MRLRARQPFNILILIFALAGLGVFAPSASAGTAGPYCVKSLTTQQKACYQSEAALQWARARSAEIDLVAVYNWINYSQDRRAGYLIFTGAHACTTPTADIEYWDNDLRNDYYYPSGITLYKTISSVSTYYAPKCDIKFYAGFNRTGASSEWIDRCTHLAGPGTGDCPSVSWYDRAVSFALS